MKHMTMKKDAGLKDYIAKKRELIKELENSRFWLNYVNNKINKLTANKNSAQILLMEDYR